MRSASRSNVGAWALALLGSTCTIGTGSFAGKTCKSNVECPDPYVCAQVRPEGRTCELLRGVEFYGSTEYYCGKVKTILDAHCVSNCHGQNRDYPGTPGLAFRLDVYSTGSAIPGAFEKAININTRIQADTMPPQVMGYSRPTSAEKSIIESWYNTGAPECETATSSDGGSGDAGSTDGGISDGGRRDGGTDAG
ncbi:MAG: hypothetical protein JNK82_16350 [Myxococcaceae bacterium]|nr:hypothetical protein [Myxococcaceae bacterium]